MAGPSRDWLNPEQGYLASNRARAKVRAWFNALHTQQTIARGREAVEKLLQREGKTATKLEDLAAQLGFKSAEHLFEVVGKDEFSVKTIETLLRPAEAPAQVEDGVVLKKAQSGASKGGVLVVGIDSLLTQLARCCKPAPPDAIAGFVTRGRGVSIHRADCANLAQMAAREPGRHIEVAWGQPKAGVPASYPVDVGIAASQRDGLLRDINDVFSKEKMRVTALQSHTAKDTLWMTCTVELHDASQLERVLAQVRELPGVRTAARR